MLQVLALSKKLINELHLHVAFFYINQKVSKKYSIMLAVLVTLNWFFYLTKLHE